MSTTAIEDLSCGGGDLNEDRVVMGYPNSAWGQELVVPTRTAAPLGSISAKELVDLIDMEDETSSEDEVWRRRGREGGWKKGVVLSHLGAEASSCTGLCFFFHWVYGCLMLRTRIV